MMNTTETVNKILDDARKYAQYKRCTYNDYEMFKRRLQAIGAYGYEPRLAQILNL